MIRPEYQNGKEYTGDSSQGMRQALVPLWGSKNEGVAPLWRFENTILGFLFWEKVIQVQNSTNITFSLNILCLAPICVLAPIWLFARTFLNFGHLRGLGWLQAKPDLLICKSLSQGFRTHLYSKHQDYFQPEHHILSTYMCSSTYMAFSQNTSHPVGRSPLWLFARTFLNFCHFEGVRMALGQT